MIYLAWVSQEDNFGAFSRSSDDAFYFMFGEVLGFINNHEGIFERTTTDRVDGLYLDVIFLKEGFFIFSAEGVGVPHGIDLIKVVEEALHPRLHLFG